VERCVSAVVEAEVGGRCFAQRGRRGFWKRGDAIRSDPQRRQLQSAEKELWEGSPFTLALSLFLLSCHS